MRPHTGKQQRRDFWREVRRRSRLQGQKVWWLRVVSNG